MTPYLGNQPGHGLVEASKYVHKPKFPLPKPSPQTAAPSSWLVRYPCELLPTERRVMVSRCDYNAQMMRLGLTLASGWISLDPSGQARHTNRVW